MMKLVSIIYAPVKNFLLVIVAYIDLISDSILLMSIMIVLDPVLVWNNPDMFSSQVGILLLASIIVPLLISAVSLANKKPLIVLDSKNWIKWKTRSHENESRKAFWPLRIFIVILTPLVPAVILFSSEKAKEKRKALINKSYREEEESFHVSTLEEFELLTEYVEESRLALLTYKRNEVCIEIVIQLSINFIMILLSQSYFPIESGLQAIFQSKNEDGSSTSGFTLVLLILLALKSFASSALTSVNIKNEYKKFIPWTSKLVLGLRYLLTIIIRIISIVTYYAPYIGLIGIMAHYQAETIPLDYINFKSINDTEEKHYHYWNEFESEFQSVEISNLFRSNYTDHTFWYDILPPSSTKYTVIPLNTAYYLFGAMYIVYAFTLSIIKYWINDKFRSASLGNILQHIIESLNLPEVYGDWDTDNNLDLNGHYKKWKTVLFEMCLMSLMQLITNLGLLVPFWVTGRVSVQRVKSLGGHFACLCRRFEFYEVNFFFYYFSKRKRKYFYTFNHFYSEKSSKRAK